MKHIDIRGWFNHESFYDMMVGRFSSGLFVELGCWLGRSSGYLGTKIKESGKDIVLDCIDDWSLKFYSKFGLEYSTPDEEKLSPVGIFKSNMDELGIKVNAIQMDVREAVKLYKDKSIDFLMIDLAPDDYSLTKEVIDLWTPKVRGVIAGKDYLEKFPTLRQAVDESFKGIKTEKGVWWFETNKS